MRGKIVVLFIFFVIVSLASAHAQNTCWELRPISSVTVTPNSVIGGSSETPDLVSVTVTMGPEPCPPDRLNPDAPGRQVYFNIPFTADMTDPYGQPWYVAAPYIAVGFGRSETTKTFHFRVRNRVTTDTVKTISAWAQDADYFGQPIVGPTFSSNLALTPLVMTLTADADSLTKGEARTFAGHLHFNAAPYITQNNRGTLGVRLSSPCSSVQFAPSTINVQQVAGVHDYSFNVSYSGADCGDFLQIATNSSALPPATFTQTLAIPLYTADNYYVAVAVDDFQPAEKKVENHQVSVTVALGQQFSIALASSNQTNLRQSVAAMYRMEGVQIAPGLSQDALYANDVALEFDSSQAAEVKKFIAVHLGTVKIRIAPNDPQRQENFVLLHVVTPQQLGNTNNDFDDVILKHAHAKGILPQYIKGQVQKESMFGAIVWRYEPIGTDYLGGISSGQAPKISQQPFSQYALDSDPTKNSPELVADDIAPRGQGAYPLKYFNAATKKIEVLDLASPNPIAREIVDINDPVQHWLANTTQAVRDRVALQPQILDFVAQTPVASSWGMLQVLYPTATSAMGWQGVSGKLNPHLLSDNDLNADLSTGYSARIYTRANTMTNFSRFDEFEDSFRRTFNLYNHNCLPTSRKQDTCSTDSYGKTVILNSLAFKPVNNVPLFQ